MQLLLVGGNDAAAPEEDATQVRATPAKPPVAYAPSEKSPGAFLFQRS